MPLIVPARPGVRTGEVSSIPAPVDHFDG